MSVFAIAIPGFSGNQTSLHPAGPAAAHIEHNFAVIFWITSIVYLLVLTALVYFVARRRYTLSLMPEPLQTTPASDRLATRAVGAAIGVTVLLLFVMLVSSFRTIRRLGRMNEEQALTIDVYGHQWWWEVQYPNEHEPYRMVITANEIHLPVDTPIRVHGTSRDVIHSFWAPNFQGKRDLLPGYNTDVLMQVDQPGRWRGQCAEFCGLQHAHMSFYMVAESQKEFDTWMTEQASPRSLRRTRRRSMASRCFSRMHASCATLSAEPLQVRGSNRPYSCCQPRDHRRGHAAKYRRQPRWMDHQCAIAEAGKPHAAQPTLRP